MITNLSDYGGLLLGSRLKRLAELMYAGVDSIYKEHGVELPSRAFPILLLLRDNGAMGITELAVPLGLSHPAVNQVSRLLLEQGVVAEDSDPSDERRRLLRLNTKGEALLGAMTTVWTDIRSAVEELDGLTGGQFLQGLSTIETALADTGFADRIRARAAARLRDAVAIIPFESRYRDDFLRLNVAWLEKYFYVEAIDVEVLSQPESRILAPGGQIFLARLGDRIVGTCALIVAADGRLELSKMAVDEAYQGLKIGRRLLETAIVAYRRSGAPGLFLESNSKLKPAIALYESAGFVHAPKPDGDSHYQRANVYMEFQDAGDS